MEIALFGGSFDPPHVGHLLAATYVLATEPVGELWLVPVNQHPLGKKLAAPFEHRAELCEAMIADAGLPRARVSRIEAEIGGEVRTFLASGADVSRLVPREVLRRIRAAGTYTGGQR